ncbi:MAG: peptide chain release factor N(5)-glutamine methyltransferase, partial [bacterium]|nr:peptide chain release factor N(5)-glutamine methyltransferase [bacterium]
LLEVLRRSTRYLEQHGSTSARLDAELLLGHALGVRRIDLYLQFERPLEEPELQRCRDLIGQRARGQPVAYLLGQKEFMKLELEVTPAVLVPNPDTELLVERAVSWARERVAQQTPAGPGGGTEPAAPRVADVGTGSGCIAVAIAHYAPAVHVWATDDDEAALEVARRNVARHELTERVTVVRGDLMEALPEQLDLICANLPYVAEGAALSADVAAQPGHALFAGDGGVALICRLLAEAPSRLAGGGTVLAELDEAVGTLLDLSAYAGHRFYRDLSGLMRLLEAWV